MSEIATSRPGRRLRGATVQARPGRLAGTISISEAAALREPERLQHRLLGGEAGGEVAAGAGPGTGVRQLLGGEEALGQSRPPLQGALEASDLDQIDADPGRHFRSLTRGVHVPPSSSR